MDAQAAARLGDEIAHGFGLAAMIAGAVAGAVVGAAIVAATVATGGAAAVIIGGCVAAGGLSMFQLVKGLTTIFNLPEPASGVLTTGSPNVFINSRPAIRVGVDQASCSGFPFNHPPLPFPVRVAEGSATVFVNGKPMARLQSKIVCGAHVKSASPDTYVGGPSTAVAFVFDLEGWLHTGLEILGIGALIGAGVLAAAAGVAALVEFGVIAGGATLAFEGLGQLGNAIGPGYGDLFQGVAGLALLFAGPKLAGLAEKPQEIGENSFVAIYDKAPAAKAEIDLLANDIAGKFDGTVATAPIKSQERAMEKILNDYGGDPTRIKDLARNTIVVPSDQVNVVAAELNARGANVKIIDAATDPLGYSGVNTTIKTEVGIYGEIQVNSPEMIYAKEVESSARSILGNDVYNSISSTTGVPGGMGHSFYEQWRALDPASAEAQHIAEQSKAYYDAIRRAYAH